MDDLHRIHYVTGHYAHLQGLRLLPLSAPFLLAAAERMAGRPFVPAAVWVLVVVASLAAPLRIGQYYARRFGQAPAPRWGTGMFTLVASVTAFLCFEWLQETLSPSISLPLLFVAVMLARLGLAAGRLRVHYLWIAAAVAVFAMLPRDGMPDGVRPVIGNLLIGGGLAIAAIGDDRVLRRALTTERHDSMEATV
jgi:hypothetical protein